MTREDVAIIQERRMSQQSQGILRFLSFSLLAHELYIK